MKRGERKYVLGRYVRFEVGNSLVFLSDRKEVSVGKYSKGLEIW